MRLLFALLSLPLLACNVHVVEDEPAPYEPAPMPAPAPSGVVVAKPEPRQEIATDGFDEVVDVRMKDKQRGGWFCTGTLIASTKVVTAAHCLDRAMFVSWEIVTQAGVRVAGSAPEVVSADVDNVANADMGVLTLARPVVLARYAELTDVTARVEAGEAVKAAAFVRIDERPGVHFAWSKTMPVSSAVGFGYEHGFSTPMFSKGGDSGAGLFLVEDGVPTHKLLGVGRQPEPARGIDHFSRVDAAFLDWYAARD